MSGVRVSPPVLIKIKEVAGIRTYIEETVYELTEKVSWPTWEELQKSSIIVLITSVIIALAVWVMDYVFGINSVFEDDSGNSVEWAWRGILGLFYKEFT